VAIGSARRSDCGTGAFLETLSVYVSAGGRPGGASLAKKRQVPHVPVWAKEACSTYRLERIIRVPPSVLEHRGGPLYSAAVESGRLQRVGRVKDVSRDGFAGIDEAADGVGF